jgi:hypothetical protein
MHKCLTAAAAPFYRPFMSKRAAASAAAVASAPPRNLVADVRDALGVSRRLFARLTGYSERAIASWEGGRELAGPSRQRMLETRRLDRALARVMKAARIADWLEEPNRAFQGLKPLEVIERGEIDRIWRMLFELESGQPG